MGFAKPIEQYLFGNLLTEIQVIMYLKDIIRGVKFYEKTNAKNDEYGTYGVPVTWNNTDNDVDKGSSNGSDESCRKEK